MVLKKSLKKFLIIGLVAVTVVWFIALYLHIQDYNRYIQDTIEGCIALGFDEYFCRDLDFHPVFGIGFGGYLVLSAFIIFWAWAIVLAIPMHTDGSQTKQ